MTYVSRRARITVPRWPNDFDPEFLFRVGRRCDGRLKRHNSCHDLRAWINDNCIKNEYLLELMSDGEVTLTPPIQLYGRFVPVPLLFKLLQNSRPENTDWDFQTIASGSDKGKDDKGGPSESKGKKPVTWGDPSESKGKKPVKWGDPSEEKDVKPIISGHSILRKSPQEVPQEGTSGEETHFGTVTGQGAGVEPTSGFQPVQNVRRKWDPFEKMEHYTSGFASRGSTLIEGFELRQTSTQTTLVIEDDNDNDPQHSRHETPKSGGSHGSVTRVLWEKTIIERNLFKSTCLLTKALGKLEKIDSILQLGNEEMEKMRKGEIREVFHKLNCIYLPGKNACDKIPSPGVKYRVRSPGDLDRQETLKCNELLRQISGLREKLKKNQECQQKINQEIKMSQKEAECGTFSRMTELNDEEDAHMRKLQKRLESLISHRGKLLSDMCQALTLLNNLKRSRNSRENVRQRSKSGENRNISFRRERCNCGCRNCISSESERAHCSDSGSSTDNNRRRGGGNYYDNSSTDKTDSGQQNSNDENYNNRTNDTLNETFDSKGGYYKENRQDNEGKKATLRFCSPDPTDREVYDTDLKPCEKYRGTPVKYPTYRPSTSPTTKREKWNVLEERQVFCYGGSYHDIPERRVKSETTMKEIEKTLRNYEQRLSDMDGLECKVEEWKRKLLEASRWKRIASKIEAQKSREQENERNEATSQINGLFMQNYELKKQVRQLTDKSKEQAKKIQNMKNSIQKTKELENEAEELKKELTEYRTNYEHQRKCISKWESVVALQRKEIENLMNHIRKLTTEKKEQVTICCQERQCVQRTRSCSPVTLTDCQNHCRPESYNTRSDEENGSCCCQDFRQSDSRRNQLRYFDKNYYSSLTEKEDWCD